MPQAQSPTSTEALANLVSSRFASTADALIALAAMHERLEDAAGAQLLLSFARQMAEHEADLA